MAVSVQVLSDVHLEYRDSADLDFPAEAVYLALCGDIGDPASPVYASFLERQAARFRRVFVVAGNHCYHGRTVDETHALIAGICARIGNATYLNMTRADLDGRHSVLGCTLWSHVEDEQRSDIACSIGDYRRIRGGWTVDASNAAHGEHVAWLRAELQRLRDEERVAIVLTHHAPLTRGTAAPKHAGSPLSSAYATDLGYLIRDPIALWAYGHTHHSNDQVVNGVRVVSNQVGYPGEGIPPHAPAVVVTVP